MKYLIFILAVIASSVNATPASFLIAASSSSDTYQQMLAQIQTVCGNNEFVIEKIPGSGGAIENLEQLVNNKANAAFIHSDVIYAKSQTDGNYRKYKTLVNLYPEEIHIVALRTAKETTGGVAGFGAKPVIYKSLSEMVGLNVGASGGSAISASILAGTGGGHFTVVPYGSGKAVLAALDSGEIQAAIFVGGAPLQNIADLKGDSYKLIPIGDSIKGKVAGDSGVYKPAVISYTNLRSDSIQTVSTSAIIVTRTYSTPEYVAPQKWFRECFYEHLTKLQETPNTHKKWSEIDPTDQGVWQWYEFGVAPAKK